MWVCLNWSGVLYNALPVVYVEAIEKKPSEEKSGAPATPTGDQCMLRGWVLVLQWITLAVSLPSVP